eukprot:59451-Amphidinium_carterae.1
MPPRMRQARPTMAIILVFTMIAMDVAAQQGAHLFAAATTTSSKLSPLSSGTFGLSSLPTGTTPLNDGSQATGTPQSKHTQPPVPTWTSTLCVTTTSATSTTLPSTTTASATTDVCLHGCVHEPIITYQLPAHCIHFTNKSHIQPLCRSTHVQHNLTVTYNTTCSAEHRVPTDCVALSLYSSSPLHTTTTSSTTTTTSPMSVIVAWITKNPTMFVLVHVGQLVVIVLLVHVGQLVVIVFLIIQRYYTTKAHQQRRRAGEPFGALLQAPHTEHEIQQLQRDIQQQALPQARQPQRALLHLLPPRSLLQGGAPPQPQPHVPAAPRHHPQAQQQDTLYSSPPSMTPHCLYAAILFSLDMPVTMQAVQDMRESIAELLELARVNKLQLAGAPLSHWARQVNMTEKEYVRSTCWPPYRRGNSLDASLCASVMGSTVWLFDAQMQANMLSHPTPPAAAIQHTEDHFRVIATPTAFTPPLQYDNEKENTLPLALLAPPRTTAMTSFFNHNNSRLKRDALLTERYIHTHLPLCGAHLRLRLATPIFNYNATLNSIPPPEMTVSLGGTMAKRTLPTWTAVTYVLAEVETESIDPNNLWEIYDKMDLMIQRTVEQLIKDLLQARQLEAQQAKMAAAHVLERTMLEHHPRNLQKFIVFYIFHVRLPTSPTTYTTTRMTFQEYERKCNIDS